LAQESKARNEARELLKDMWRNRSKIWNIPPPLEELIPVPVEKIVRSVLGLTLIEPEEIVSDQHGVETAGLINRETRQIIAAQKYRHEWRRFTVAHEIGHWVLHPNVIYHRDRPLTGAEQSNTSRPLVELEADKFASELLMPTKVLTKYFQQMFSEPIDGRIPSVELARWLSDEDSQISAAALSKGLRYRSLLVARKSVVKSGKYFKSLANSFGVSITAMAIQLEDLKLVL
jgi:Zn-dependent peptidase ImmA (M78 family)